MTPLQIEILMCINEKQDLPSGTRFQDVESLRAEELLPKEYLYPLTERGRVYVEALCKVPLPVQKWVMPEEEG